MYIGEYVGVCVCRGVCVWEGGMCVVYIGEYVGG